jgi:hypothetical protein
MSAPRKLTEGQVRELRQLQGTRASLRREALDLERRRRLVLVRLRQMPTVQQKAAQFQVTPPTAYFAAEGFRYKDVRP